MVLYDVFEPSRYRQCGGGRGCLVIELSVMVTTPLPFRRGEVIPPALWGVRAGNGRESTAPVERQRLLTVPCPRRLGDGLCQRCPPAWRCAVTWRQWNNGSAHAAVPSDRFATSMISTSAFWRATGASTFRHRRCAMRTATPTMRARRVMMTVHAGRSTALLY